MAMSTVFVPPSRLATLKQLQSRIFQTSYNPKSIRTGAKYLRARLRGPSMLAYYPQSFDIAQITRRYSELDIVNEDEEERLQDVLDRKKRGKGPPKKAKSKGCRILNSLRIACTEPYRQRKADGWAKSDDDFSTCLSIIFNNFIHS
jgi:small subunit ribosomal protein S33